MKYHNETTFSFTRGNKQPEFSQWVFDNGFTTKRTEAKTQNDKQKNISSKETIATYSPSPAKSKRDEFLEGFNSFDDSVTEESKKKQIGTPSPNTNYTIPTKVSYASSDPTKTTHAPYTNETLSKSRHELKFTTNPNLFNLAKKSSQQNEKNEFLSGFNESQKEDDKWNKTLDEIGHSFRTIGNLGEKISSHFPKNIAFTGNNFIENELTYAIIKMLETKLKGYHYSRNQYNSPTPQTSADAKDLGWEIENKDFCHQFTSPDRNNVKYISPDEKKEVIFDATGKNVITSEEDKGTYNFFNPDLALLHGLFDVAPWVLWGNSPEDSTNTFERISLPLIYMLYR